MPTILKSVKLEYTHTVEVGSGPAASAPAPEAATTPYQTTDPDSAVLVSPPAPEPEEDLAEVQAQVEMMLNQARSQVAVWQEEAQQAGWQAGYDEAQQAAMDSLAEALATARQIARSAAEAREKLLRQSQSELHRLAMAIAEKVIGHELSATPEIIADIVTNVVENACVREACIFRVNPDDYDVLHARWSHVAAGQTADHAWELVADRRISRGGCLIEVNGGSLDARLETRLAQVAQALDNVGQ
jgi:flagellar biosynthesis/type III secretory pathway protein FliH